MPKFRFPKKVWEKYCKCKQFGKMNGFPFLCQLDVADFLGYRKQSVMFQHWFRQKSVHECVMPLLHLEHDHMICNWARPLPRNFQPKARFDPIYEKLTNYIYQDQTINIPSVSWIGLQLNLLSRLKPLRILARLRIWWLDRGLRET